MTMTHTTFTFRNALTVSALSIGLLFSGHSARAADWTLDGAKSTLGFSGTQTGTPFKGHFGKFGGTISLDPQHPETGHIQISIDMASAATGDAQRDGALPGKDWFSTSTFPTATFESSSIRLISAGHYEAQGKLTIRNVTKPLTLPFTLAVQGQDAHATGHVQLVRTNFGVGQGPWVSGQWVALEVGVDFDLTAHQ